SHFQSLDANHCQRKDVTVISQVVALPLVITSLSPLLSLDVIKKWCFWVKIIGIFILSLIEQSFFPDQHYKIENNTFFNFHPILYIGIITHFSTFYLNLFDIEYAIY